MGFNGWKTGYQILPFYLSEKIMDHFVSIVHVIVFNAMGRATGKDLGQLVFSIKRFFSQIVFSGFLIVLISFF